MPARVHKMARSSLIASIRLPRNRSTCVTISPHVPRWVLGASGAMPNNSIRLQPSSITFVEERGSHKLPGHIEQAGSLSGASFRQPVESRGDLDPVSLREVLPRWLAVLGKRPAVGFRTTTAVALSDDCGPLR